MNDGDLKLNLFDDGGFYDYPTPRHQLLAKHTRTPDSFLAADYVNFRFERDAQSLETVFDSFVWRNNELTRPAIKAVASLVRIAFHFDDAELTPDKARTYHDIADAVEGMDDDAIQDAINMAARVFEKAGVKPARLLYARRPKTVFHVRRGNPNQLPLL